MLNVLTLIKICKFMLSWMKRWMINLTFVGFIIISTITTSSSSISSRSQRRSDVLGRWNMSRGAILCNIKWTAPCRRPAAVRQPHSIPYRPPGRQPLRESVFAQQRVDRASDSITVGLPRHSACRQSLWIQLCCGHAAGCWGCIVGCEDAELLDMTLSAYCHPSMCAPQSSFAPMYLRDRISAFFIHIYVL